MLPPFLMHPMAREQLVADLRARGETAAADEIVALEHLFGEAVSGLHRVWSNPERGRTIAAGAIEKIEAKKNSK